MENCIFEKTAEIFTFPINNFIFKADNINIRSCIFYEESILFKNSESL